MIKNILAGIGCIIIGLLCIASGFLGGLLTILLAVLVIGIGVGAFLVKNWLVRGLCIAGFALAAIGVIFDILVMIGILGPFIV